MKSCFCEKGYKEKIVDIREEILRKRRAGKLPGDSTSVLKAWWQSHSKWPYPTVSPYPTSSITDMDTSQGFLVMFYPAWLTFVTSSFAF